MNDHSVKQALYSRLSGDATLTGFLADGASGIQDTVARQGTTAPFIVYQKMDGRPSYTMGDGFDQHVYMVKVITEGNSLALAGTVAARIDTLLHDAPLTVSGADNFALRREADIELSELDAGKRYAHKGHTYRLHLQ